MLVLLALKAGQEADLLFWMNAWGNCEYLVHHILLALKRYSYWGKVDMIRFSKKQGPEEASC